MAPSTLSRYHAESEAGSNARQCRHDMARELAAGAQFDNGGEPLVGGATSRPWTGEPDDDLPAPSRGNRQHIPPRRVPRGAAARTAHRRHRVGLFSAGQFQRQSQARTLRAEGKSANGTLEPLMRMARHASEGTRPASAPPMPPPCHVFFVRLKRRGCPAQGRADRRGFSDPQSRQRNLVVGTGERCLTRPGVVTPACCSAIHPPAWTALRRGRSGDGCIFYGSLSCLSTTAPAIMNGVKVSLLSS